MKKTTSGFTIVELLIVIAVIGILAVITVVAYNGVRQRAVVSALKADLTNARKSMDIARSDTGSYPTTFPSDTKASPNVSLSLSQSSDGYCINAQSITYPSIQWSASTSSEAREGLCSGAVIAGSELGVKPNIITNASFGTGWNLNFQNPTGRTLTTRAGVSGDPYSTRPVLVLTNTGTGTTNWCVLQSVALGIAHSKLVKHMYVRIGYEKLEHITEILVYSAS
jgi:prepilin-type N-terminal cleavage/methylation domain-containing protein